MTALQQWLIAAGISAGPLFRKLNRGGAVESARLVPDAVRQILLKRAAKATPLVVSAATGLGVSEVLRALLRIIDQDEERPGAAVKAWHPGG